MRLWHCKTKPLYFENRTNARPVEATFVWWPIHKIEAMFLFNFIFFVGGGIQLYVFLHVIQYAPISFFHFRPVFVWYWRTIPFVFSSNRVLSCKCTVYEIFWMGTIKCIKRRTEKFTLLLCCNFILIRTLRTHWWFFRSDWSHLTNPTCKWENYKTDMKSDGHVQRHILFCLASQVLLNIHL